MHIKVEAIEQFLGFATKIKFSRDSWTHKWEDHVKKIHSRRVNGFGAPCAHMSKYLLEVAIKIRLNINSKHFNFTWWILFLGVGAGPALGLGPLT